MEPFIAALFVVVAVVVVIGGAVATRRSMLGRDLDEVLREQGEQRVLTPRFAPQDRDTVLSDAA